MKRTFVAPAEEARGQMINFMKNVSIAGGLVFVLAVGAGPVSIDALRERRASKAPRPSALPSSVGPIGPGEFNS